MKLKSMPCMYQDKHIKNLYYDGMVMHPYYDGSWSKEKLRGALPQVEYDIEVDTKY